MQKTIRVVKGVVLCKECGTPLPKATADSVHLCTPCKTHNMTVAILKYPIGGFGEE